MLRKILLSSAPASQVPLKDRLKSFLFLQAVSYSLPFADQAWIIYII